MFSDAAAEVTTVEEMYRDCRFFASYSGVKLPFNLVNPIAPEALSNRNTFIRACFDGAGLLVSFDKIVYGEIELSHRYSYHADGALEVAEITMLDEETIVLRFDDTEAQSANMRKALPES
jgi:hypothetical protein